MKTVISVKVDKDVRDKARTFAKKVGLPLSTIINHQLQQVIDERRIEFREPLIPNAQTRKILDEALRDTREGREEKFSPAFTTIKDMDRWLDSR